MLVLTAILLALLYGVRQNGPVQNGVGGVLTGTETAMKDGLNASKGRFGF